MVKWKYDEKINNVLQRKLQIEHHEPNIQVFGHCVVCSSSIYRFWLPLWYFQVFGHCVVCSSSIYGFWLPLWYFQAFDHCVVCSSSIYGFWLPLWYLQTLLTWWRLFHKHVVVPKIKYLPFLLSTNMNHIITKRGIGN
jgi:predicted nucleic acid-binding Zn ribbon protein